MIRETEKLDGSFMHEERAEICAKFLQQQMVVRELGGGDVRQRCESGGSGVQW